MKKILFLFLLLLTVLCQAQEHDKLLSYDDAISFAKKTALKTSHTKFLNAQFYSEENVLIVRFVPLELSKDDYDKMNVEAQNRLLTLFFKKIDDLYVFDSLSGSYDLIFKYWQGFVSNNDKKDNGNKKFFDKENKVVYLMSEDNDESWKITFKKI